MKGGGKWGLGTPLSTPSTQEDEREIGIDNFNQSVFCIIVRFLFP